MKYKKSKPNKSDNTNYKISYSNLLNKLKNFEENKRLGVHEYVLHKDLEIFQQRKKGKLPASQLYKYFLKVLTSDSKK